MEKDPTKCHFYESLTGGFHRYYSAQDKTKFIGFAKNGRPINFMNTKRKPDEKCYNLFKEPVQPITKNENNNLVDISSNIKTNNGGNGSNNNSNKESNKKSMPANSQSNDVDVVSQHPKRHHNHHKKQQQLHKQQQQENYEVSGNGNSFKKKTQYSTISSTSERSPARKSSQHTRKQNTKKQHLTNANKRQFQKQQQHEERTERVRPIPTNNYADYPPVKQPKLITKNQVHHHQTIRTPDQRRRSTSTSTVDYY